MQSYKNYEIILIDDGSTDYSLSICESLKKKSDKITVLSQNNSGVSAARNNGIKKSKGEYLLFIDADDVVEKTMLETLMKKSENDIVISGFKVIGSDLIKNDTSALKSLEKINVDKELLLKKIISTSKDRVYGYVWRTLFKAEIIKDKKLSFNEDIKI